MKKYAIVNKRTGEFYADPIYTDIQKGRDKIRYLEDYRVRHNMPPEEYVLEELSEEREAQHDREWREFVSMLD